MELASKLDIWGGHFAPTRYYISNRLWLAEATGKDKPATAEMMEVARRLVDQFVADLEAREAMISGDVGSKALDAAQQFGKIVNHPAKLNFGDCFTYACAKAYRMRIAYKGDDFGQTDLGW